MEIIAELVVRNSLEHGRWRTLDRVSWQADPASLLGLRAFFVEGNHRSSRARRPDQGSAHDARSTAPPFLTHPPDADLSPQPCARSSRRFASWRSARSTPSLPRNGASRLGIRRSAVAHHFYEARRTSSRGYNYRRMLATSSSCQGCFTGSTNAFALTRRPSISTAGGGRNRPSGMVPITAQARYSPAPSCASRSKNG